jgi:hypothetical protein
MKFIETPANKRSLGKRKPLFGIGINDAKYKVTHKLDGSYLMCKYYVVWSHMLERCYSETYKKRCPTYEGCTVCDEWLLFSEFKSWMETQDWKEKELDKDILKQGNKEYSPSACLFITKRINVLFRFTDHSKTKYMTGACLNKSSGKYYGICRGVDGSHVMLGDFDSENDAHEAYMLYKYSVIASIASEQVEPLRSAMLNYIIPD